MSFTDLVQLALRGLSRRMTRTILTTLGITVAVASMVIFLSLGEGIRKVFTQGLADIGPDIQVSINGLQQGMSPIPDVPETLVAQLEAKASDYGIKTLAPIVVSGRSGGFDPRSGYVLYGYPTSSNLNTFIPTAKIAKGRMLTPEDEGQMVAVIGGKAALNANVTLGGKVRYNRSNHFMVVGILAEEGGLTDSFILVPKSSLQKAMGIEGRVSYIAVKLNEPSEAKSVAERIKKDLDVEAQTQADFLKILDRAVSISDAVRFGISLIALIVGGLAVANTVMMGVFERTREFGTMRAMGAKSEMIQNLVLLESLILAFIGGIGGVLLGLLGIGGVNLYTQNLANISAAALTLRLVGLALLVSFVLGLLSGVLPARSASRIVITEALGRN